VLLFVIVVGGDGDGDKFDGVDVVHCTLSSSFLSQMLHNGLRTVTIIHWLQQAMLLLMITLSGLSDMICRRLEHTQPRDRVCHPQNPSAVGWLL
jgi:hypothetical protein